MTRTNFDILLHAMLMNIKQSSCFDHQMFTERPQRTRARRTKGAKDRRILLHSLDHLKNPSIISKLLAEYIKADVDLNSNRLL